jgi:acetyltransferase-like isoleucine patch superfamily enzyme
MVKALVEKYVRKSKNPSFSFDDSIPSGVLFGFVLMKIGAFLRGLRVASVNRKFSKVFFGRSVSLFNRSNIFFGDNVNVGDFVRLHALGKGMLSIGNNVNIGSFSQVVISTTFNDVGEFIEIGDGVGIGEFSYLGGAGGLEIGKDTIIGQYFSTHPENHIFSDPDVLIRKQGVVRQGIKIGANCWVGAKVTVLDGVVVGDNCVIAAGAVVNKSFNSNVVIGGVPAKVIKELA